MRAPAVTYEEHPPCAPLRAHVACYWTLSGDDEEGHRVLPDGCMDLIFDMSNGAAADASLVGTMTTALVARARRACFFGVRFRPGEAFAFVGVPAYEARDKI